MYDDDDTFLFFTITYKIYVINFLGMAMHASKSQASQMRAKGAAVMPARYEKASQMTHATEGIR